MTKVYVITGASRGIGLELVRQILAKNACTAIVVGTVRDEIKSRSAFESIASNSGGRLKLVKLDTTSEESIKGAAEHVSRFFPDGIDVLINNAGIMERDPSDVEAKASTLESTFHTNVLGPILVGQYFLPLLRKRTTRIIANMSSPLGIVGAQILPGSGLLAYRMSKASLNMVTTRWAKELASENFIVVSYSPGWVKTDMGGPAGMLTVEESVSGMVSTLFRLKEEDSGTFIHTDGKVMPWGVPKSAAM
ncbi:NAD(P)-binding protein [Gonapodya prolifera JEL478]|uniref:NAD(P)-binding protein n=1 Tax=Gonapodya prolifera (strain JEL478) TaxID=1344416 RepID=A0A139AI46_GONPJ|nr:NAD(P)-binding protein [Gonapodya prolifera JEL478]|eukprot:KXS16379.1 NAD(P)-binding protein [Gonapodya prolifera JEL478]